VSLLDLRTDIRPDKASTIADQHDHVDRTPTTTPSRRPSTCPADDRARCAAVHRREPKARTIASTGLSEAQRSGAARRSSARTRSSPTTRGRAPHPLFASASSPRFPAGCCTYAVSRTGRPPEAGAHREWQATKVDSSEWGATPDRARFKPTRSPTSTGRSARCSPNRSTLENGTGAVRAHGSSATGPHGGRSTSRTRSRSECAVRRGDDGRRQLVSARRQLSAKRPDGGRDRDGKLLGHMIRPATSSSPRPAGPGNITTDRSSSRRADSSRHVTKDDVVNGQRRCTRRRHPRAYVSGQR